MPGFPQPPFHTGRRHLYRVLLQEITQQPRDAGAQLVIHALRMAYIDPEQAVTLAAAHIHINNFHVRQLFRQALLNSCNCF